MKEVGRPVSIILVFVFRGFVIFPLALISLASCDQYEEQYEEHSIELSSSGNRTKGMFCKHCENLPKECVEVHRCPSETRLIATIFGECRTSTCGFGDKKTYPYACNCCGDNQYKVGFDFTSGYCKDCPDGMLAMDVVVSEPSIDPISDGVCYCPSDRTMCGAECVNLQTHNDNCGSCNHACTTYEKCRNGTCHLSSCPSNKRLCNGICVPKYSNNEHCGMCNRRCAWNQICDATRCVGGDSPIP